MNTINKFYPGTKFGITEYDYGGHNDITGGIAQADALGIFGISEVSYACIWASITGYLTTAFNLYLNYDGNNSKYGLIKVMAKSNDIANSAIYASVDDNTNNVLHSIVTNKNASSAINATININSKINYDKTEAYYFNKSSQQIKSYNIAIKYYQ